MNSAIHQYTAAQRQTDLVREARRHRPRPEKLELDDVERPKPRRLFWLLQASRSAA